MKFNFKKLGMLVLYTLVLVLFGNKVVGLLFSLSQFVLGLYMPLGILTMVMIGIIILTPILLALPFCLELKDGNIKKT